MGALIGKLVGLTPAVGVNMSSPKAQFVLDTIQNQKVVIFSKSYCPYCTMAKDQFNKLKYPFFCIELDHRDDADEIQNILGEMTGARTVPRVFIDGKFIGGGVDVKRMQEEGRLKDLLNL